MAGDLFTSGIEVMGLQGWGLSRARAHISSGGLRNEAQIRKWCGWDGLCRLSGAAIGTYLVKVAFEHGGRMGVVASNLSRGEVRRSHGQPHELHEVSNGS